MDSFLSESLVCAIARSVGFVAAQTDPTIRTTPKIVRILTFMARSLGRAETDTFKIKMLAFFYFFAAAPNQGFLRFEGWLPGRL